MGPMYLHYFTNDKTFPFFIQYGYHEDEVEMHIHADYDELVIVLNGTAMHDVDRDSYFIKKGDVFVLGNGVAHSYRDTNELQICNIMFRPDSLIPSDCDIRQLPGFHALFVIEPFLTKRREFQSRLSLNLDDFENIHLLLDQMIAEYNSKEEGRKTVLSSLFLILTATLSRLYTLPGEEAHSGSSANIINIAKSVSYMERHFKEEILVERLAKLSNLSTRHFTRIFFATYHTTPGNYILSLRMQYAAKILRTTGSTISETAFQSGFNDSNYFSRQFRKYFGVSPREYRKQQA